MAKTKTLAFLEQTQNVIQCGIDDLEKIAQEAQEAQDPIYYRVLQVVQKMKQLTVNPSFLQSQKLSTNPPTPREVKPAQVVEPKPRKVKPAIEEKTGGVIIATTED
jgi:hypothetical protein